METIDISAKDVIPIEKSRLQLEAFLKQRNLMLVLARLDENGNVDESKDENIFLAKIDVTKSEEGDILSRTITDICNIPLESTIQVKVG